MVQRLTQFITKNFKFVVYAAAGQKLSGNEKAVHEGSDERAVMQWLNHEGDRIRPGALKIWQKPDGTYLHLVREITG